MSDVNERPDLSKMIFAASGPSPLFVTPGPMPADPFNETHTKQAPPILTNSQKLESPAAGEEVNWTLVAEIRDQVAERLASELRELDSSGDMAATRVQLGRSIIRHTINDFREEALQAGDDRRVISADLDGAYARAVESSLFGHGRWQPLLDDPDVENIEIRGYDKVFMVYADRIEQVPPVADSAEELIRELQFRAGEAGKQFSPTHPEMTMNLGDTHRLHAFGFDVADPSPTIVIRQHKHRNVTLQQLAERDNLMPPWVAHFLDCAIKARRSLVVGGDQGSGKTTFLRGCGASIPFTEAVGIIETDPELFLHKLPGRARFINLTARDGSDEAIGPSGRPVGEVALPELLVGSLRQNLQRIIVGEVRGPEAATMFQAMQAGAGSMSTIHAQHAEAIIERLVTAAAQQGVLTQDDAYRQIAININLLVFIGTRDRRGEGGKLERFIDEIIEIDGFSETSDGSKSPLPAKNPIYQRRNQGSPVFHPSPRLLEALRNHGWDPATVPGYTPLDPGGVR